MSKKKVTLEDLKHDPSLIDEITPLQAADFVDEASETGLPGNLLSALHAKALAGQVPPKTDAESENE